MGDIISQQNDGPLLDFDVFAQQKAILDNRDYISEGRKRIIPDFLFIQYLKITNKIPD